MKRFVCSSAMALVGFAAAVAQAETDSPDTATDDQPGAYSAALMVTASEGSALVDALAAHNYQQDPGAAPIATLRAVSPLSVSAFRTPRPTGDFRLWIAANPSRAIAKLDRYVVAHFESRADRDLALSQAVGDPQLSYAHAVEVMDGGGSGSLRDDAITLGAATQPQHALLATSPAWDLGSGWALVGSADNGIDGNHPLLRSRTLAASTGGAWVPGGPYVPYFSANTGSQAQDFANLLETQPQAVQYATESGCDESDGSLDGFLNTQLAGHGTHTAGLIATNPTTSGTRGVCPGCSLAVAKISVLACNYSSSFPRANPKIDTATGAVGLDHLMRSGVQVANLSFGVADSPQTKPPVCDLKEPAPDSEDMFCLQLRAAKEHDIVIASASGNDRKSALDFPARDPRVVAVGGLSVAADGTSKLWDFSPSGDLVECPFSDPVEGYVSPEECGTNFSHHVPFDPVRRQEFRQELLAPATNIRSTFEAARTWNSSVQCGDGFGDSQPSDAYGACTGTSMSAPMVSGVAGLLRSLNPLVTVGDPFDAAANAPGIRDVLAASGSQARSGASWDEKMGFGHPSAFVASTAMLGKVAGTVVRNRAIPLFRLYSAADSDYAHVASPQMAVALSAFQADNYVTQSPANDGTAFIAGTPVPGYPAFPFDGPLPRAAMHVLATAHAPLGFTTPLHLLDRCSRSGGDTCRGTRDLVLATDHTAIQRALSNGYAYAGKQGFIFAPCSPEPECIPAGAERVLLQCSLIRDDCAVFLDSEKSDFESGAGGTYTSAFQQGPKILGYAFAPRDTDADGLIDGFESMIGTSFAAADSDGDGVADGVEYPVAGLPASDPCIGDGPISCPRAFRSGFEDFQ